MTVWVGQRARPPSVVLKAAVVVPDVIISSLIGLLLVAALPPTIGLGVTLAAGAVAVVLATGLGEDAAVCVLYVARRPSRVEAARLAGAWSMVTSRLDTGRVRLRISSLVPPVTTAGRRHVIVSRQVIDAHRDGRLTDRQLAALLAQGVGRLRHGHSRFDLVWTFWTMPWDLIRGFAVGVGSLFGWVPLIQFAWKVRFIVGSMAVVLEAQAGRWPSPIIIAAFISLSYLMPWWRRTWETQLTEAARCDVGLAAARSADG